MQENNSEGAPKDPENRQESVLDKLKKLRTPEMQAQMKEYVSHHTREVISYAILTIGILLLFFSSILGQALIGIVSAVYFSAPIIGFFNNWDRYCAEWGTPQLLILSGVIVAFFIQAPFIFIGAGGVIGLKYALFGSED